MSFVRTVYNTLRTYGVTPTREAEVAYKLVAMRITNRLVVGSKRSRRYRVRRSQIVVVSNHSRGLVLITTTCCIIDVRVNNFRPVLLLISWLKDHYILLSNLLYETARQIDLYVHISLHCT